MYPLTFNDDVHGIGCVNCLTTTYELEFDVALYGVPCNPKSPYVGVKNPAVLMVKLLLSSIDKELPYFKIN